MGSARPFDNGAYCAEFFGSLMGLPVEQKARTEKSCSACGVVKPVSEFHASNRRAGARVGNGKFIQSKCKRCQVADKAVVRARNRAFLDAIKMQRGCVDCGYRDNAVALDFHHIIGNKEFSLSDRRGIQAPLSKLEAEIEKCVVVCANCHRKRHYLWRCDAAS